MAFRNNNMENSLGMGQKFLVETWNTQYGGPSRKAPGELSPGSKRNMGLGIVGLQPPQPPPPNQPPPSMQPPSQAVQPPKPRKTGLFGEDEDNETSMYFPQSSFRTDRDMMSSGSPSQLSSGFGNSNFYSQGLSNFTMPQQRGITGPQFRGTSQGHVTPTSMHLPLNLQQAPQQPSPNRNIISAIGGQRSVMNQNNMSKIQNRPIGSGMPSSSTPISNMNNMNNSFIFGQSSRQIFGNDENQPGLDLSEFPSLSNRGSLPNSSVSSIRNYGMVSKPVSDQTPEFQIQQEDFPALPGATNPPSSSSGDATCKTPTSLSSGIGDTSLLKDGKYPGDKAPKRGIQTHQDGTVSNIPNGMVNDQFGIVGLLTFIRAAENDPNLVALAPGIDLTTLGLNLNSPENLYSTFQSPWKDLPCRPQDIDFHVPAEYLTNIYIRDKLAPIKLNRYGEDLLFYLFYMNGGDVLQLASAAELYSRDWRYHKEERVWITRAPGVDPILKTNTYEQGTYYVFDTKYWRKVHKEIYLEYEKLEDRPNLPPTMVH
ncbi:CCR4-NOT transcription complex subunit 2-like isoform X2 [Mytilus californianus]|uniref:CCR4-NOT transcription complex subunit 2-like isoform X2 n=1 Tax=Mytilus californianus TaxID=6549 RepID=UPI0022476F4E|nr:CCR4-NOT transcription complex subunit 2-like isoform X2 [Mytilus californianus]